MQGTAQVGRGLVKNGRYEQDKRDTFHMKQIVSRGPDGEYMQQQRSRLSKVTPMMHFRCRFLKCCSKEMTNII